MRVPLEPQLPTLSRRCLWYMGRKCFWGMNVSPSSSAFFFAFRNMTSCFQHHFFTVSVFPSSPVCTSHSSNISLIFCFSSSFLLLKFLFSSLPFISLALIV